MRHYESLREFVSSATIGGAIGVAVIVAVLIVMPFLLIWSVNTLGANIEHCDRLVDKARAEILQAAGSICCKYGFELNVEVTR